MTIVLINLLCDLCQLSSATRVPTFFAFKVDVLVTINKVKFISFFMFKNIPIYYF